MKGIQRYAIWQALLLLLLAAVAGCSKNDDEKGTDENEGGGTPVVNAPEIDKGEAGAASDSAGEEQKTADADAGAGGEKEAAKPQPAADGWLGADDGEGAGASAAIGGPKAAEKRVALKGQTRTVKDIQVTEVKAESARPDGSRGSLATSGSTPAPSTGRRRFPQAQAAQHNATRQTSTPGVPSQRLVAYLDGIRKTPALDCNLGSSPLRLKARSRSSRVLPFPSEECRR